MDAEQQVPEAIGSTGSSHTQPPVASHLSLLPASSLFPFTQQSKITSSKEELQDERMRNGSFTMSQPLKMDGQKPGVLPSFIIHEESKESLSLESEDEEMINCDILIEEQQEPITVVQQLVGNEDKKKTSFDEQNENEDEQHENEDEQHENEHQQNENEDNQNENEKQSPKNESTEELYVTQSNDGIDPHKNEDTRNKDTGNEDTGNEDHDTRVEHEVGQNENEDIGIENLSTSNSPQQYQSKSHTKVPETISALTLDVITSSPLSLAAKEIDDSSLFRFTNPIPPLSKAEVLHTLSNEIITDGVEVPLVFYSTPPQWRCASTSPPCKRQKVLLPALSPLAGPTGEEEEDDLDDGEATLFQALPKEGAKESVTILPGNASCSSRNSSHWNNDDKSDDCFTVPDDPVLVHEEEDITSFHSDIITNRVSIDTKSVNEEQSRRQLVVSPPMTKPVLKRGKKECNIRYTSLYLFAGYLVDLIEPCQFNLSTPKLRLGLSKRNKHYHHKIQ